MWVFSNEVDTERSPLAGLRPGQQVEVRDYRGRYLGTAYVNPHTLICARIFTRQKGRALGYALILERLERALALRERRYPGGCYRLVAGEGDGLPGLIVDRFQHTCVVQLTTAGMESLKTPIVEALNTLLRPAHIILRNDTSVRQTEKLELYVETAKGNPPDSVEVEENGTQFQACPVSGQKTGWYYDHRDNRARLFPYVPGARVLDVFSYTGAWGIQAARAGAREVLCLDDSAPALEAVHQHAQLNGVRDRVSTRHGDAFKLLKCLHQEGQRFDIVIVDPPAFIKRKKKDLTTGKEAYRRINQLAMELLPEDGLLVSSSCSYHLKAEELLSALRQAALHLHRGLQILERGHQAADHVVHPAIPETAYLKTFFCRLLDPF